MTHMTRCVQLPQPRHKSELSVTAGPWNPVTRVFKATPKKNERYNYQWGYDRSFPAEDPYAFLISKPPIS